MTQLETSRLILRPWCGSDAQALYRWARDPEVGPSAGWAPHTSVENSREIIRTVLSEEGTFAVLLKGGDGGPIGSVGVFPTAIPVGKGEPEIGYWIAHPYWGQGLVPEAVEELLRWQFQEMGVQRVWCAHSPEMRSPGGCRRSAASAMSAIRRRRRGPTERSTPVCARPSQDRNGRSAMGDKIYVPYQEAESEFVEKRSRFIGHIWPVDSEDQAQELIRRVKKQHYDARHNCWCYLLGSTVVRYSDDGEPQGTAGQPMLAVFQREHVTNVLCVVTRYFGGILLGAGGLTRAYSKSARDALAAAGVAAMGLWTAARCTCPYPLLERVKLEVQAVGGTVDAVDYGAEAALTLSLPEDAPRRLQDRLTELSAGRLRLELSGTELRPGPREDI